MRENEFVPPFDRNSDSKNQRNFDNFVSLKTVSKEILVYFKLLILLIPIRKPTWNRPEMLQINLSAPILFSQNLIAHLLWHKI